MSKHKIQEEGSKRDEGKFSTGSPVGYNKWAQDVRVFGFYYSVGTDQVDSWDSASNTITAASHSAKRGDLIRFSSGDLSGQEFTVNSVTTNTIILNEDPEAAPAGTDAFSILRLSSPQVDSSGSLITSPTAAGAMQIKVDGTDTFVAKDTGTPANTVPIPVEIVTAGTGVEINVTAGDINIHTDATEDSIEAKQTTHDNLNLNANIQVGDADVANGNPVPVSDAGGSLTVDSPDLSTIAGDTTSLDAKVPNQGAALTAASLPVNIASDQTVPVSAASLPLPTGAATSANQVTANSSLSTIEGDTTSLDAKIPAQGAALTAASLPVNIASDQTVPISASSLPLPTGAATESTLSTLNGKVTACNTGAVTISSALPAGTNNIGDVDVLSTVRPAGRSKVELIRNDYTSASVTTGAYVQLVASTSGDISLLDIFDSSGQTLVLATGAAASEVDQLYITPGGNGQVELAIPSGTRIAVKAVSATASVGELTINALS